MRKNLLLFPVILFSFIASSQVNDFENFAALQLINTNKAVIGLSDEDITNLRISSTYFSKNSGLRLVYLQQTFLDIPVFNQIHVLAFKNDSLVSNAGGRIAQIEKWVNVITGNPSVSAEAAVMAAIADRNLNITKPSKLISKSADGHKVVFNDMGVAHEKY